MQLAVGQRGYWSVTTVWLAACGVSWVWGWASGGGGGAENHRICATHQGLVRCY